MRQKIVMTYLGVVAGFLALLLLSSSVWLEMRINTALVLPLFGLVGFAASLLWTDRIPPTLAVILQFSVVLLFFVRYGIDAGMMSVMPAMLLREGFYLHFLSNSITNLVLVILMGLGNIAVLADTGRSTLNRG